MGFIDNIKNCFTESELPISPVYRAVLFGDNAIYFESVCSILYYSEDEISLALKKGSIKIVGRRLYVKKYCAGDVVICGKILKIERQI